MKNVFTYSRFLTEYILGKLSFLTIFFTLLTHCHPTYALENGSNPSASSSFSSSTATSSTYEYEKHQRLHQLLDYLRAEAPHMVPALPDAVRAPARWAMEGMDALRDGLYGFGLSSADFGDGGFISDIFRPVASLMRTPDENAMQATWLSASYRHKGFLPNHDAIIVGFNARQRGFDNMLQFDMKPFYGQNWHRAENIYGMETSLSIGKRDTSDHEGKPWGKISLRYVNGDNDLMDNGHGFDLHSEINFTERLALHAGVREKDNSDLGNYVLLRWKITDLGQ